MGVLARSSGEHFFKISNDQLDVLAAGLDLENLSGIVDEMDDEPCLAPCSGKSDKRSLHRHGFTQQFTQANPKDVADRRPSRQRGI